MRWEIFFRIVCGPSSIPDDSVIPPTRVDEMKQNLGLGDAARILSKDQMAAIRKFLGADILVPGVVHGAWSGRARRD